MSDETEFMGYEVRRLRDDREPGKVAYHLIGKRGACYSLWRRNDRRGSMYVTNKHGNVCSIKGNYNFTDERGRLECLYY